MGIPMADTVVMTAPRVRPRLGRDEWLMGGGLCVLALYLAVTLLVPLVIICLLYTSRCV